MSEVAICNQALSWLGESPITSLDDPTKAAALCKANYAELRDAVLEESDWTFAKKRRSLPASATAPAYGYGKAYPLPGECLHVLSVNEIRQGDPRGAWIVEDREILTNDSSCRAIYIKRLTDTGKFSSLFKQALAARLAAELAIPLTASRSLQAQHFQLYEEKRSKAAGRDGQQGKSKRIRSRWMENARISSGPRNTAGPEV